MKNPMFVCHQSYFDVMNKEDIGKEIIHLKTAIDLEPENSRKSAWYFRLALLYAHYNNPTPNYSRSLNMFEKYLELNPDSLNKDEVLYMKTLVQKLVEADEKRIRMTDERAQLNKKNKTLTETNAKLIEEKQNLMDAIEKLKLLELMLEEKRLNFK